MQMKKQEEKQEKDSAGRRANGRTRFRSPDLWTPMRFPGKWTD